MLEFSSTPVADPSDAQEELFPQSTGTETTVSEDLPDAAAMPRAAAVETAPQNRICNLDIPGLLNNKKYSPEEAKLAVVALLTEARKQAEMSIESVAATTRINIYYLHDLEAGNFDELPQGVYVLAYLRKLCELYGISREDSEFIVRPWLNIQHEIPENLPNTVLQDDDSENQRIIRKIEKLLYAVVAIVIIGLVVFGIILLVSNYRADDRATLPDFDENKLLELQQKPSLSLPGVPVGRKSGA